MIAARSANGRTSRHGDQSFCLNDMHTLPVQIAHETRGGTDQELPQPLESKGQECEVDIVESSSVDCSGSRYLYNAI